jgi:hypothetical protein
MTCAICHNRDHSQYFEVAVRGVRRSCTWYLLVRIFELCNSFSYTHDHEGSAQHQGTSRPNPKGDDRTPGVSLSFQGTINGRTVDKTRNAVDEACTAPKRVMNRLDNQGASFQDEVDNRQLSSLHGNNLRIMHAYVIDTSNINEPVLLYSSSPFDRLAQM